MTDYGATATLDRKGRVILPPDLMATDRPDPDAPNRTVRGVQRVDVLADMFGANPRLWAKDDRRRYWAAELFRDDWELGEEGANPEMGDRDPTLRQKGGSTYCMTDARIAARTRLREAQAAIPSKSASMVRQVVIEATPVKKCRNYSGRKHSAMRHALMVGLDALAGHYEGMGR